MRDLLLFLTLYTRVILVFMFPLSGVVVVFVGRRLDIGCLERSLVESFVLLGKGFERWEGRGLK